MSKTDLLVGYGYVAQHLSEQLIRQGRKLIAICRDEKKSSQQDNLHIIHGDITQPLNLETEIDTLYYFIPPQRQGVSDETLQSFLHHNPIDCQKIIYFGSSGVYGDHQGNEVNEVSHCYIQSDRQRRRIDAEQQWQAIAKQRGIDCAVLRIAGIYGPGRLPLSAVMQQTPVIKESQAPFINYIFVGDLCRCAISIANLHSGIGIYNICDGKPRPMGSSQQLLATLLAKPQAEEVDFQQAYLEASPFKREFMNSSKRLNNDKIKHLTQNEFTPLEQGLRQSLADDINALGRFETK